MADEIQGGQNVDVMTPKSGTQTSEEVATTAAKAKPADAKDTETGTRGEGQGGDEGAGDGAKKDDINPDTGQPYTAEEWRDKFRASAKGANELLEAKKTLEAEIARVRADSDKSLQEKEAEITRLREVAEGKNPEGLTLLDLQKKYGEVSSELVVIKESKQIDDFIASTKIDGADSFKEALRALGRANPSATLAQLWDANLKVAAEAAAAAKKGRDTTRREGASDTGRGSSSREHQGDTVGNTGLSLEEFNKLPVEKRRALLLKS